MFLTVFLFNNPIMGLLWKESRRCWLCLWMELILLAMEKLFLHARTFKNKQGVKIIKKIIINNVLSLIYLLSK